MRVDRPQTVKHIKQTGAELPAATGAVAGDRTSDEVTDQYRLYKSGADPGAGANLDHEISLTTNPKKSTIAYQPICTTGHVSLQGGTK